MDAIAEPNSPSSAARYHSLDGLRGVMMLLGIVLHAVLPYLPAGPDSKMPFTDAGAVSEAYGLVIYFIHSFRMPVFFVMAGFFTALLRQRRGAAGLLANRFRRIVLPFLVGWVVLFPLLAGTTVYLKAGGGLTGLRAAGAGLISGELYAEPNLTYLWFLYDLAIFYPVALAVGALARRFAPGMVVRVRDGFRWVMRSSIRPAWMAIPTAFTLWPMVGGGFDTSVTFTPSPSVLAAYGVFFAFGWLLHGNADLLPGLTRHAWTQVVLAMLLFPLNLFAGVSILMTLPVSDPALHLTAALSGALIAWLLVFGITGLFVRHFDRPSPRMRYLTDASYWCYLAHFPLLFWIAALLAPLPLISPLKVLLLITLTTAILLLAYDLAVRPTILGHWLNGARYPRRLVPFGAPAADAAKIEGIHDFRVMVAVAEGAMQDDRAGPARPA